MTFSPTSNALSAPTNEFPSQGQAAIPHPRGRTQGLSPAKVPTTHLVSPFWHDCRATANRVAQ
jgi:hypothetical protein